MGSINEYIKNFNGIHINYNLELNNEEIPDIIKPEDLQKIYEQVDISIFKIIKEKGKSGTGFLCKIPYPDFYKKLHVLITCYHVLKEEDLIDDNKIEIKFQKNNSIEIITKTLLIDKLRKIYFSKEKEYDITIIEILPTDNFDEKQFLEIDNLLYTKEKLNDIYKTKTVYILHYPRGFKALSFGTIKNIDINNSIIEHNCATDIGSSGSPIINIDNKKGT